VGFLHGFANAYLLPFATATQLDQALEINTLLIESDPSITISRWNRSDAHGDFIRFTAPDAPKQYFEVIPALVIPTFEQFCKISELFPG
jgi:hypothetical protein